MVKRIREDKQQQPNLHGMHEVNQGCWNLSQTLGQALITMLSSVAGNIDQALMYRTFLRVGGRIVYDSIQQFRKGLLGGLVPSPLGQRRPLGLHYSLDVIRHRALDAPACVCIEKLGKTQ